MRPVLFVFKPGLAAAEKRQPRGIIFAAYGVVMKRTLTVILAILMMLFAAGCYGNTAHDGTTRSRAYGGGVTRGRAYNGAYDGLYRDGNRSGFIRDGAHAMDGAMRDGATTRSHGGGTVRNHKNRAHGGTVRGGANHRAHDGAVHGHKTRARDGAVRGGANRVHDGVRGRTTHGQDGFFTDGTAARDYQNHQNNRPMVGGLDYLR